MTLSLAELDRYRGDTLNGQFDINNILQRDLEFRRFAYEYTRVLEPLTYQLQNRYLPPKPTEELYRLFNQLEDTTAGLPLPESHLSKQHLVEVGRTAYEATEFLKFLRGVPERALAGTSWWWGMIVTGGSGLSNLLRLISKRGSRSGMTASAPALLRG